MCDKICRGIFSGLICAGLLAYSIVQLRAYSAIQVEVTNSIYILSYFSPIVFVSERASFPLRGGVWSTMIFTVCVIVVMVCIFIFGDTQPTPMAIHLDPAAAVRAIYFDLAHSWSDLAIEIFGILAFTVWIIRGFGTKIDMPTPGAHKLVLWSLCCMVLVAEVVLDMMFWGTTPVPIWQIFDSPLCILISALMVFVLFPFASKQPQHLVWLLTGCAFATAYIVFDLISVQTAAHFLDIESYINMFQTPSNTTSIHVRGVYFIVLQDVSASDFAYFAILRQIQNLILTALGWSLLGLSSAEMCADITSYAKL